MSSADKLTYFALRARGEPIRVLYSLAGKSLDEEKIASQEWPEKKKDFPTGKVPILTTDNGVLTQSASIIRYAAKKLGLFGKDLWEEALHDMIIENTLEVFNIVPQKVYIWKVFKFAPEPEDTEEPLRQVRESWLKCVTYLQSVAEKRGKKFLVNNEIGAADVVLYCSLEFSRLAVPDIMSLTPWVKGFCEKFETDEGVKKYLAARPESACGI